MTLETNGHLRLLKKVLGPRRYRIALLRYGRDLSSKQIGYRLGITKRAVNQHLRSIRATMGLMRDANGGDRLGRPLDSAAPARSSGWPPPVCLN